MAKLGVVGVEAWWDECQVVFFGRNVGGMWGSHLCISLRCAQMKADLL
jgi:hypothetical protein